MIYCDFLISDKKDTQCRIIEVTVPLDTNLEQPGNEKQIKYIELILRMHNLYNAYTLSIVVVAVGAMESVQKILDKNLQKIFSDSNKVNVI